MLPDRSITLHMKLLLQKLLCHDYLPVRGVRPLQVKRCHRLLYTVVYKVVLDRIDRIWLLTAAVCSKRLPSLTHHITRWMVEAEVGLVPLVDFVVLLYVPAIWIVVQISFQGICWRNNFVVLRPHRIAWNCVHIFCLAGIHQSIRGFVIKEQNQSIVSCHSKVRYWNQWNQMKSKNLSVSNLSQNQIIRPASGDLETLSNSTNITLYSLYFFLYFYQLNWTALFTSPYVRQGQQNIRITVTNTDSDGIKPAKSSKSVIIDDDFGSFFLVCLKTRQTVLC